MPIFEYVCEKCSNQFEKLHKSTETDGGVCPNCGASEVNKQLSSFSAAGKSPSTACHSSG